MAAAWLWSKGTLKEKSSSSAALKREGMLLRSGRGGGRGNVR